MTESWIPSERLVQLRADQRTRWQLGERVRVEDYLVSDPQLAADDELLIDLIYSEFSLRAEMGESPDPAEYLERFPQQASQLSPLFELCRVILAERPTGTNGSAEGRSTSAGSRGEGSGPIR